MEMSNRPRRLFVLSGGGALGAVQVGQLRALTEAGIEPDAFVACSVGALNAAGYAASPRGPERVAEIDAYWRALRREDVFPGGRGRRALHIATARRYLHRADGIRRIVEAFSNVGDIAELEVPVSVATCDLTTGQLAYHDQGDPYQILTASCALPGVFPPVLIAGSHHVDGGVLAGLPLDHALTRPADEIWVLDCSVGTPYRPVVPRSALGSLITSFAVARYALGAEIARRGASDPRVRVLPAPDAGTRSLDDFSQTGELIDQAYVLTAEALADGRYRSEPIEAVGTGVEARRRRWRLGRRARQEPAYSS